MLFQFVHVVARIQSSFLLSGIPWYGYITVYDLQNVPLMDIWVVSSWGDYKESCCFVCKSLCGYRLSFVLGKYQERDCWVTRRVYM